MAITHTQKQYPCGCTAIGPGDLPDYCSTHGMPPKDDDMPKVVTKPDGWDLRYRRAQAENDAKKWKCGDVLYDAQEMMKTRQPAVAAAVIWYTRNENGSISLKFTCAQEHDRQIVALAADFLSEIGCGASTE